MKRYRLTAGLAIAGAAAIAFPAIGSATSSSITLTCDRATFTYTSFGATGQAPAPYSILVDGQPFLSGTLAPAGPLSVFRVALNLTGTHVVYATTQGTPTNAFSEASASVSCGPVTPPSPAPSPVVVVPPETPVPVEPGVRIITCSYLRNVGAGQRWLVKFGCARKPPPLTCADLKARGAGLRWLVARGCSTRLPGPFNPPVTG